MKDGVAYFENHCETIVSILSLFENIYYSEANKEGPTGITIPVGPSAVITDFTSTSIW